MVSAKLSSRLGSVKLKDTPDADLSMRSQGVMKRPTKPSLGNNWALGSAIAQLSNSGEKPKRDAPKK